MMHVGDIMSTVPSNLVALHYIINVVQLQKVLMTSLP